MKLFQVRKLSIISKSEKSAVTIPPTPGGPGLTACDFSTQILNAENHLYFVRTRLSNRGTMLRFRFLTFSQVTQNLLV